MRASARRTDPRSSHVAAIRAELSHAGRHRQICLNEVLKHHGQTSAEIALQVGLDRHQVARRLPELEKGGLVRKGLQRECKAKGSRAVTWWPAEPDGQGLLF